jgi:hypothetical protein
MKDIIENTATALSAAEVIARRMPVLWWAMAAPNAARQGEVARMVTEKNAAFVEGLIAAQFQAGREALDFWTRAMTGRNGHDAVAQSASRILSAAAGPATRRVKANARRLRKRTSL